MVLTSCGIKLDFACHEESISGAVLLSGDCCHGHMVRDEHSFLIDSLILDSCIKAYKLGSVESLINLLGKHIPIWF